MKIAGTSSSLPEKVLTNHELEKMIKTTDARIVERTGIRERRIADAKTATSDLVADALLNPLMGIWYWLVSKLDKDAQVTFLNYGYAGDGMELGLREEDKANEYSIRLYHHVVSAVSLKGLDVLEVGCGRGGGASYIARYLEPGSVTGIDVCREAIKFCKKHYSVNGLSFSHGDALKSPFGNDSFDVVINVESSHRYADMNRFLREVRRVLRPGGHFLFADFRYGKAVDLLRRQLSDSGLVITREQRITSNVVRALSSDDERRSSLVKELVPRFLHKPAEEFAGTKGTGLYESLVTGKREYLCFVLQRRYAESGDASESPETERDS